MRGPNFVFDTIRAIEYTIAILTLLGSSYVFSPLYHISVVNNGASIFNHALGSVLYVKLWALALLIGSVILLYGLIRHNLHARSAGLLVITISRFFQVLTTILSAGFLPISWIYILTVAIICLILWFRCRAIINVWS